MQYFDFHTHKKDSQNAVINLFDDENPENQMFYSVGLHPLDIDKKKTDSALAEVEKTARSKNVVAIGECGFDKNASTDFELQKEVFIKQCKISEVLQKPMIIHCVGYYDEIIKIIKQENLTQNQAIHAYNKKNEVILRKLIKAGFYVSLAWQAVTDKSKLEVLLPEIPPNKLFLETDDNDKLCVENIYKIVAEQMKINPHELNNITTGNFDSFRFVPRNAQDK